jgi:hypothetical protein
VLGLSCGTMISTLSLTPTPTSARALGHPSCADRAKG